MNRTIKTRVKKADLVNERRQQIIVAATDVFLASSYHAATVSQVGERAGLSQGAIYNYLRSKKDILYLICDEAISAYLNAVTAVADDPGSPADRLVAAVRAIVEVMYDRQDLTLLFYREAHSLDWESHLAIRARLREFIQAIAGLIEEAAAAKAITVASPTLAADILTYLPTVVALRAWRLRDTMSRREVVDGLTDFLLRGLGLAALSRRVRMSARQTLS